MNRFCFYVALAIELLSANGINVAEAYRRQLNATDSWFKRPLAQAPKFEQKAGESNRAFYSRVEVESNDFMKIAKYENENECKVVENEKGELEVEQRTRRKQIKTKE